MDLEVELDKILKIKTSGRDDSKSNYINFPYEPTPYCVLQELSNSGYITKADKIIDYGSGNLRNVANALDYEFPDDATGAYFFNPFSIKMLEEVIKSIRLSKKRNNREIKLFFYYPSKEYISFLKENDDIIYLDYINCMDLFRQVDKKECIAIYKL